MDSMVATADPIRTMDEKSRIPAIMGGASGNLVEWYDFYVYSFCSLYFAPAFFPSADRTSQLLNTAGIFAAGFLMRPIGSFVFGTIADRQGRRTAMMISVLMMCGGSLLIAVMYVALWFKSVGRVEWFFWYVTALCGVALVVALAMPDPRRHGHLR